MAMRWNAIGIAAAAAFCAAAPANAQPRLFEPGPDPGALVVENNAVYRDAAATPAAWVRSKDLATPENRRFMFNPPGSDDYTIQIQGVQLNAEGDRTITGSIVGVPQGTVCIRVSQDTLSGIVRLPGDAVYEIAPMPNGHRVRKWLRFNAVCTAPPTYNVPASMTLPKEDDTDAVIDVLAAYTPAARSVRGSAEAIEQRIRDAVAAANTAYRNSNLAPRLRLVGTVEVDYTESGDLLTDIERLTQSDDTFIDAIHDRREELKADVVSLFIDGARAGIGWQMRVVSPGFASSAFSVVDQEVAASFFILAHEIGHNMGCSHEHADGLAGAFNFAHAHVTPFFTTLMNARIGVETIQHFSNPFVFQGDVQTGEGVERPRPAHNARVLDMTAATVAGFRDALFEVTPFDAVVSADGDTLQFNTVYRGADVTPWEANPAPGASWITFPFDNEGVGSDSILIDIAPNPSGLDRSADITFSATRGAEFAYTVTVRQPACDAPGPPSAVVASNGDSSEGVRVVWSAVSGATAYRVYRAVDASGGDMIPVSPWLDALEFIDTTANGDLPVGCNGANRFFYAVRARNACGDSGFSGFDAGFPPTPAESGLGPGLLIAAAGIWAIGRRCPPAPK